MRPFILLSIAGLLLSCSEPDSLTIDKAQYHDQLKGFWLGSCIANWTGLKTENQRSDAPFFTDADWGTNQGRDDLEIKDNTLLQFELGMNPWGADDDTDIEYIYQHAMTHYETTSLTGEEIAETWNNYIDLPLLWVSNLAASGQMQNGAVPPNTSLPENNPMWDMIDAQLTTEIFGALAPGRPDVALEIGHLPVRTTAYMHAEWAAEFYIIMYSLVSRVDKDLSPKEQVFWMANQARKRIPDWSYIADMYDFVKQEYEANPDYENWEKTRDKVYERYQKNSNGGYVYKYAWDAGINFAASMVSLFYGEADFKKTVKIGTLSGWDSDNPTATWGGMLGLLYGAEALKQIFEGHKLSEDYNIERTRPNLPIKVDSFEEMANQGIAIIDKIVAEKMGGEVSPDSWIIPKPDKILSKVELTPTIVPWRILEDSDLAWTYKGFEVIPYQWNASGATLTKGYENCEATLSFEGTAVAYFAYRSLDGGKVKIELDGEEMGEFSLFSDQEYGQHYVKIFEHNDLEPGQHTLRIIGDGTSSSKTIDLIQIIE